MTHAFSRESCSAERRVPARSQPRRCTEAGLSTALSQLRSQEDVHHPASKPLRREREKANYHALGAL